MRITRLEAENFKRLKAIDITPDGNTVVIKGRNAQGKSSVLDAIWAALGGRAGAKELVRPIRDGETRARVVVELDDLVVERKWTASGSTVKVSPKAGNATLNSPQKILDELIGALSFDPLAFAEAEPKKQVDTLIDLIGREKFDALAAERRNLYEERTELNRDVKNLRARLDAIGDPEEVQSVDQVALSLEYGVAQQKLALRERWERAKAELDEVEAKAAALPDSRDIETVNTELSNAVEINVRAERWRQAKSLRIQLAEASDSANECSNAIAELDEQKALLIESSALPVPGLAFDDDGITYNGVPFIQSSAAERLKVSVAMAMALNPELRVISIRDASLLDDESKMALVALAQEHDYQIWYEVVGTAGEVGVIIEDGEVQA